MPPSPKSETSLQQLRQPLLNECSFPIERESGSDIDQNNSIEDASLSTAIFSTTSPFTLNTNSVINCNLSSDQITAMLSNFSTSYNVVSISLVIPILQAPSLYLNSLTPTSESVCASSLLGGMIIGQLIGGTLGDTVGRWNAMYLVMGIQILGTFGSALLVWESPGQNIFDLLAAWRFVLGIGCGGVYPLAAALSAEQKSSSSLNSSGGGDVSEEEGVDTSAMPDVEDINQREKLQKLALTFSTQGVGFAMVPIVTYPLLFFLGPNRLDYAWRIILAIGAVPGIVLAYLRYRWGHSQHDEERTLQTNVGKGEQSLLLGNSESSTYLDYNTNKNEERNEIQSDEKPIPDSSLWESIREEPDLFRKLCGTALTWFLFDIVFYGNTLFEPIVLEAAFGTSASNENHDDGENDQDYFPVLLKTCRDSLFLTSIALPGYFITIGVIGRQLYGSIRQTPRFIQSQGFIMMTVLYAIIGSSWNTLKGYQSLLVLLYGGTFFFANYGPNTTTFLLPFLTYSKECRTTLNGISAACGKAGALVGASMFEPLADSLGDGSVMLICACISLIAAILTLSL